MRATIRQFGDADFGGVLRLWQNEGWTALGPDRLTLDQAIELLRADGSVAVVAETDGEISGAAVGAVVGPTAWILRLAAASGEDPLWQSIPVAPADLDATLEKRRHDDEPAFGLVLPDDDGFLLVGDPDGLADRLRREAMSRAVRALDLAALHVSVLEDRLGIGPDEVAAGRRLAYTRSEADARERVARGEAAAAILVRPTRLDQLAEVANAGDVMPQKSTYFYPKLLTGMVFNPLED